MTPDDKEAVMHGYLTCALWSSVNDDGDPLDDEHGIAGFSPTTYAEIEDDLAAFLDEYADDCEEFVATYRPEGGYDPWECLGHDIWLTRNHHGAGFWDRGLGDLGERLTDAATHLGEVHLYVGDDGLIYQEG